MCLAFTVRLLKRAWFSLYLRGSTIFINLFDWAQSFDTFGSLPIGHFHDLKVAMILKVSLQNWFLSRILVAGSMCQIIPVRLVRLLYFQVFISEGVSNIGLFQN